jgi:hypothetical protein
MLLSAGTLTGCASSMQRSQDVSPQASLRQPCPDLQSLPDSTGATLLRWALATVKDYRICQDRHGKLVEATAPLAEPGKTDYRLKP